jgi:rod shape-determining protein MreC
MPLVQSLGKATKVTKSSIGLGLATRQMSASSLNDRKQGKTFTVFLGLSFLLLLSNIFASDITNVTKHHLSDKTIFVTQAMAMPFDYVATQMARISVIMDVQKNNEQLALENQRLLEWFQTANRLDAENKALRDLLNMKEDDAVTYHSAKVISDSNTQYSHTILVKLGENDGLSKGQGVLSFEGLIGRVIDTGAETSRVLLMSDVNSRIPVTVEGTNDRAILAGTNNGDPILDHLPETHSVKVGQKIITSGHGGVFPYGVPVGETYLNADGQLAVRPFADANRANHVQIVDYGVPAGSSTRATASAGSGTLR